MKHKELFRLLYSIGINSHDIRLVENLYWNQKACVKIDNETSDFFDIKKGVRQGCVLSPDFFNLYSDIIFRELEQCNGIKIGGQNLTNLRYADDAVLMAYTTEDVQQMLNILVNASDKMGLSLNVKKTECMVVNKERNDLTFELKSKNESIKQVKQFKYLGAIISNDVKDTTEIKHRIACAKGAFHKLKTVLTNSKISLKTKLQLINTYVLSALLYACESWTLDMECQKRIEAFEMWIYRRLLKIPWTAKTSNVNVLNSLGKDRELLTTIARRQMKFLDMS